MRAWPPLLFVAWARQKSGKFLFKTAGQKVVFQKTHSLSKFHSYTHFIRDRKGETLQLFCNCQNWKHRQKSTKNKLLQVAQSWTKPISAFRYSSDIPWGGAPFLEVLQYQVDAWSGQSKLLFQLLVPKIHLISQKTVLLRIMGLITRKKKCATMCSDDVNWAYLQRLFHDVYKHWIIVLYTWNKYIVCQLYLNKKTIRA